MKHTILPGRTSGASPHLTTPGAPPRRAPAQNVLSASQRARIAEHDAQLIDPTIGGDDAAVVLHIGGARVTVPSGTRVAPGAQGVLYVLSGATLHVLVESSGRVQELMVDDDLASQIKAEAFGH